MEPFGHWVGDWGFVVWKTQKQYIRKYQCLYRTKWEYMDPQLHWQAANEWPSRSSARRLRTVRRIQRHQQSSAVVFYQLHIFGGVMFGWFAQRFIFGGRSRAFGPLTLYTLAREKQIDILRLGISIGKMNVTGNSRGSFLIRGRKVWVEVPGGYSDLVEHSCTWISLILFTYSFAAAFWRVGFGKRSI